jgi:arginine decarboxylase
LSGKWSVTESAELYQIPHWGQPYFAVNDAGNLVCRPRGADGGEIDFKLLVDDLGRRGIEAPLLIRFNDVLDTQVKAIAGCFQRSIDEYGYRGSYRGVLPIKVNQQAHVVEELVRAGADVNLGLEAGSKPELLVAIALLEGEDRLLVCNGYKDREYVETALGAQRLGLHPVLVVDRFAEVDLIIDVARELEIRPHIGVRMKLTARGAGRWQDSSGEASKFGLTAGELVRAIEKLRAAGMLECLELVHFHVGSQITSIRSIKDACGEAARVYSDLRKLGADNLSYLDVGGGLAIDYDGSKTDFHSSRNYSMQEYANDVVWAVQEVCEATGDPQPTIVSESGRALVAHHSVLVFNVLGVNSPGGGGGDPAAPADDEHAIVHTLWEAYNAVSQKGFQEGYNDALTAKEESATLYRHGVIDLSTRARIDELYWATLRRIQRVLPKVSYVPDELDDLDRLLSDTFFCNFSIFQSLPDSWAVNQLFPIVPLHRLDEEPRREAILADLTCDSHGCLGSFIDLRDVKDSLRLHDPGGAPYYLGVFLVGAYQETLGDLHNLFGDTNAVHVSLGDGGYLLEHFVKGDRVGEVLRYVEYDPAELVRRVRRASERAVRSGAFTLEESADFVRAYEAGLGGYTYLEDID